MNSRLISLFLLALSLSGFSHLVQSEVKTDWSLEKDRSGIQVYIRDDPNSILDEFKGITIVKARLSSLVKLARDTAHYQDWMHRSGGAEILDDTDPYRLILHSITLSPWPTSDRDVILRASFTQRPVDQTISIELESVRDYAALESEYIRMPYLNGGWVFEPLTDGAVKVTYQMKADPAGSIPSWLAGSSSIDMPFKTLENMREMLKLPRYANAKLEDINEPRAGADASD